MITPGRHQEQVVEKFVGVPWRLIGDSMGVGKTLSGVMLDMAERHHVWPEKTLNNEHFKTLIVCTKGGLSVWKWHLEDQGVSSDRILVIDPSDRSVFATELDRGAVNYDYYIMHYAALELVPFFEKVQIGRQALVWDHIIVDEAHLIKNRKANRKKILGRQKARLRTAITGTPADDKPQDIWSILNWLDRQKYSSYWRFVDKYVDYTEEYNHKTNHGYRKLGDPKNIDEFHREIGNHYIRRTLPEVRGSMPPKTHSEVLVDLTDGQLKDYRAMEEFQTARIEESGEEYTVLWMIALHQILQRMTIGTVTDIDWTRYNAFWERHRDTPLDELPKHAPSGPKLIIGEPSPKLDAVMEKVEEAMDAGESLVVLSNYREMGENGACEMSKGKGSRELVPRGDDKAVGQGCSRCRLPISTNSRVCWHDRSGGDIHHAHCCEDTPLYRQTLESLGKSTS